MYQTVVYAQSIRSIVQHMPRSCALDDVRYTSIKSIVKHIPGSCASDDIWTNDLKKQTNILVLGHGGIFGP